MKSNWYFVKLKRTNLWNWFNANQYGDYAHYSTMVSWCENTYTADTWNSRYMPDCEKITKEFSFKHEKDKTLFLLKWV